MLPNKLLKGDKRTVRLRTNVLFSFAVKGIDALVYLLLVPVTLGYLNPYEYGIWLTLNSMLMWINSFDIGLGNGLRNKLAEALAKDDKRLARAYVSTTFFMLILIVVGIIALSSAVFPFVDWYSILNTDAEKVARLNEIVYVSFLLFCLNFVFNFVGHVYMALQLPAVNNFLVMLGHLLSLVVIYVLTRTTSGSLMAVAVVYSATPVAVYVAAYPVTFSVLYKFLAPTFRAFRREHLRGLMSIGLQFFLLQLSSIVLFTLSNLIISHLFGPESVTPYNIAFRYFSIVSFVMTLVTAPMWAATTDAYAKGDIAWITKSIRNLRHILYIAALVIVLMVAVSKPVYRIWVGSEVEIPYSVSLLMGAYFFILIWSLSYSNFLNGLGKLCIQTVNTVTVAVLFCPVCIGLGHALGTEGIVLTMCLTTLSGAVLNTVQFHKVIRGTAQGIWNK